MEFIENWFLDSLNHKKYLVRGNSLHAELGTIEDILNVYKIADEKLCNNALVTEIVVEVHIELLESNTPLINTSSLEEILKCTDANSCPEIFFTVFDRSYFIPKIECYKLPLSTEIKGTVSYYSAYRTDDKENYSRWITFVKCYGKKDQD